jgi:protease I
MILFGILRSISFQFYHFLMREGGGCSLSFLRWAFPVARKAVQSKNQIRRQKVNMSRLSGKKIAILLAEGVEDLEFYVPMMRLQEEGAEVLAVGLDLKPVRGKNGLEIKAGVTIDAVKPDELSGLILPGGWAPDKLRRYPAVTDLVKAVNESGKVIGIICHGGLIAISAKIVAGRKATGSLGIKDDLVNAGATWVDEAAFRDGNQVWGRVVADIPAFCRELVAALVDSSK